MPRAGDGGGGKGGLGVYRHLTQVGYAHKGKGGGSWGRGRGARGGLGGLGVCRHLTQERLSTQGFRSVASRVQGSGSGLGSKLQGLGFLCRGLVMRNHGLSQHRVPPMHHNYVHWNGLDRWQGQRGCEMWQGHDF